MKHLVWFLVSLTACAHNSPDFRNSPQDGISAQDEALVFGKFSELTFNGVAIAGNQCQIEISLNTSPQMKIFKKIPVEPGKIFHFSSSKGDHKFSHLACSLGPQKKAYIFELNMPLGRVQQSIHYLGEFSLKMSSPKKTRHSAVLALKGSQEKRQMQGMRVTVKSNSSTAAENIERMRSEHPEIIADIEKKNFQGPLNIEISEASASKMAQIKMLSGGKKRK